jgi:hypothetical protein
MSSGNWSQSAPFAAVTSTDRGAQLLIVNIIGLIFSLSSVALRVAICRRDRDANRSALAFHNDDLLCFAAFVCGPAAPFTAC